MSILDKKHILTINLDKSSIEFDGNIRFYNTDKNIANLFVKIKKKNSDGADTFLNQSELEGVVLKLTARKPKTNQTREMTGILTEELIDQSCAIYKFELSQEFTDQVGSVVCEFELSNANGEKVTIDSFSYIIKASELTGLNAEIESNPDLPVLKALIEEVKETAQTVNNIDDVNITETKTFSNKKIDEKFSTVNSQIKEIPKKTSVENGKLYLLKDDGTKMDTGTTLPTNSSDSSSIQTYITEDIGELFSVQSNYIAWCPNNLIYDKTIDKYIGIINCANAHAYTSLTRYLIKINPDTFVVEEMFSIEDKIQNSSGSSLSLMTSYNTISSLILLDDGSYMFFADTDTEDVKHRFISVDCGETWVESGIANGIQHHPWAFYKMSNGRLLGSYDYKNFGIIYSDDNGLNWTQVIPTTCGGGYEAEVCILELSENNLMAIGRYSSSGIGYNESGDSEHAIISYSTDNGTTWTPWQISSSIDNMNAASCCGVVHDGIVEIFTTSRWWKNGDNSTTDYDNTGKQGAIIHYTATIENALNDNFTRKGIIDYARGNAQEYHAPSIAMDNNKNILIMHMDTGSIATCTQRFIRGSLDNLSYLAKDGSNSTVKAYSAYYTEVLFENMLDKINYLQYMVSQIEGSGVDAPTGTLIWTLPLIAEENTSTTFPALLTSKSINYTTRYETDTSIHSVPQADDNNEMYWGVGTSIKMEFPTNKANYAVEFEFNVSNLSTLSLVEKISDTVSGLSYWNSNLYIQGISANTKQKMKIIRNGGTLEFYVNDSKVSSIPSTTYSNASSSLYATSLENCILVTTYGGRIYNLKFGEWDS